MTLYENELLTVLELFGGHLEDLAQRTSALENCLSPRDRQKYEIELRRVRARGPSTDVALALEVLREKILPSGE